MKKSNNISIFLPACHLKLIVLKPEFLLSEKLKSRAASYAQPDTALFAANYYLLLENY